MTRKVVEIWIVNDCILDVRMAPDYDLARQLGVLEWAKAVLLEGVRIENALREYNEKEV